MSMEDFIKTLNNEQKEALLKALNNNSPTIQNVSPEVNEKTKQSINDNFIAQTKQINTNTQQRRKEPVKGKKNTWEDTGEFREIETPQYERTQRKRPPPQKTEVDCHICGKSFKIDPRFVCGEYHKCNKCSSRR